MLKGKKVLLGITGGIAAYKCCELIRLLRKSGAEVQAMVTRHALDFVTLTVLKALTSNEPLWDGDSGRLPIEHIRAAEWADLILVAPAPEISSRRSVPVSRMIFSPQPSSPAGRSLPLPPQ